MFLISRGFYLWLDTMVESEIKWLIVWLIEWSESTLSKSNLAAPRLHNVPFVAKGGKQRVVKLLNCNFIAKSTWIQFFRYKRITVHSGFAIARVTTVKIWPAKKRVVSEQKRAWPDKVNGAYLLVIVGKAMFSEGEYDIVNIALAFELTIDVELPNWGQHAEDLTTRAKIIWILSLSLRAFSLSLSSKWSQHHQGDVAFFDSRFFRGLSLLTP